MLHVEDKRVVQDLEYVQKIFDHIFECFVTAVAAKNWGPIVFTTISAACTILLMVIVLTSIDVSCPTSFKLNFAKLSMDVSTQD